MKQTKREYLVGTTTPTTNSFDVAENEWEFPRALNYCWKGKKCWKRYTSNGEPVKEKSYE